MITKSFVLWFKLKGWKIEGLVSADIKKAVVIAAPHTSNWDFIYALAVFKMLGMKVNYLAKKELFRFPLSILLKIPAGFLLSEAKNKALQIKSSKNSIRLIIFLWQYQQKEQENGLKNGNQDFIMQHLERMFLFCPVTLTTKTNWLDLGNRYT